MRYGHPSFDDLMSSQGKGRFRKVLMSRLDSSARNRSISRVHIIVSNFTLRIRLTCGMLTLFAGFVLNFSKIFCDWDFEASEAMFAVLWEEARFTYSCCKRSCDDGRSPFRILSWNLCRGDRSGPDCDWDLVSCRFTSKNG